MSQSMPQAPVGILDPDDEFMLGVNQDFKFFEV
jgi:hypothetical protein